MRLDAPRTVVAVWALAADTEEEAVRLAASSRMAFTMLRRGRLIPVPPPDTACASSATEGDGLSARRRTIVGTPEQVRAGIEAVAGEYGAEEVIVVTITYDHAARRRSYELIAEEFGLTGSGRRALRGPYARLPPPSRTPADRLDPLVAVVQRDVERERRTGGRDVDAVDRRARDDVRLEHVAVAAETAIPWPESRSRRTERSMTLPRHRVGVAGHDHVAPAPLILLSVNRLRSAVSTTTPASRR